MSSAIYYEPKAPMTNLGGWGLPLKQLLKERWDMGGDLREGIEMSLERDGQWLSGVIAAANGDLAKQARELMTALQVHKIIVLHERN